MESIKDFVSDLLTKSTKKTYRAGIYVFLDWKYGPRRGGQESYRRGDEGRIILIDR